MMIRPLLPDRLCLVVVWVWVLASACATTEAPPRIPETPAGVAFRTWFTAYNAADSAALEAYSRRYEPAMSVHTQLTFRAQTGPYDLVSVEHSESKHLEVLLRTRDGSDGGRAGGVLTMYGTLDLAADPSREATTTLTLVDQAPARPTLVPLSRPSRPRLLPISATLRATALESVAVKVARNYVQPDVARLIADSMRARAARDAYAERETIAGFAHALTRDLVAFSGDRQLGVAYAWRLPLPPPNPRPPALLRCGLEPVQLLAGDVGYVRFYGFGGDPTCGEAVTAAMRAVADARALIIDLREAESEGTRVSMAYLASYLVGSCSPLGTLRDRRSGRTEMLWTRDGLPGVAYGGAKPLVLLTSARTAGAAEALVEALQRLGRAVVVGERTAGAAYVTAVGPVGEHLLLRVPVAIAQDVATGASWERTGVEPDVSVPATDALETAQRLLQEHRLPRPKRGPAVPGDVRRRAYAREDAEPVGSAVPRHGIRFTIDTLVRADAPWGGLLSRVAGEVEFADGRGRLDVTAVRRAPAVSLAGVTVGAPLAQPGDYYLFDNSGAVLVRPRENTFSRLVFTRTDYNHTGALLPGAFLMRDTRVAAETLAVGDVRRRQHAPVSILWHMQPPDLERTGTLYARGWLEIADAPAVEAGIARWFEVAAALTTRPDGVGALAGDGHLEVTSVALLRRPGARESTITYAELLTPRGIGAAEVDPTRLVVPAGFRETPWPGFGGFVASRGAPGADADHWRKLEDVEQQLGTATCRQAWVSERPR